MKKPDRFWDLLAKRYDKQTQKNEGYTEAVQRFAKYLEADDAVLDYACGPGIVAYKIADAVKEVHAIDTSAKMIERARKRGRELEVTNVRCEQKAIFDASLEPGSYDVILAFNILHLLEDARRALQRAHELLRPGGLLVSSTPCEAGRVLRTLLPLIRRLLGLSHLTIPGISEVRDLIRGGRFEILESHVRGRRIKLWFAVARKA